MLLLIQSLLQLLPEPVLKCMSMSYLFAALWATYRLLILVVRIQSTWLLFNQAFSSLELYLEPAMPAIGAKRVEVAYISNC